MRFTFEPLGKLCSSWSNWLAPLPVSDDPWSSDWIAVLAGVEASRLLSKPANWAASESVGKLEFAEVVELVLVLLEPAADPAASTVGLSCGDTDVVVLIPLLSSDWLIVLKIVCRVFVRLLLIFESVLCFFLEFDALLLLELPSASDDDDPSVPSADFFESDVGVFPSNASEIACSSS